MSRTTRRLVQDLLESTPTSRSQRGTEFAARQSSSSSHLVMLMYQMGAPSPGQRYVFFFCLHTLASCVRVPGSTGAVLNFTRGNGKRANRAYCCSYQQKIIGSGRATRPST